MRLSEIVLYPLCKPPGYYQRRKAAKAAKAAAMAANKAKEPEQPRVESTAPQTYEVLQGTRLNVDNPDSIQQLREMAQRGEYPEFITSMTREGRERFYEEFDKLYPDPPGILNDYRVEPFSRRAVQVYFNYNMAEAESPGLVNLPSSNTSEAVQRGIIKHAIYVQRPAVERALLTRYGGYSSYEIADRYGRRVLSSTEKAQANREIIAQVERVLGSPLSKFGQRINAEEWISRDGGWVRGGALRPEDFGYYPTRGR